MDCRVIPDQVEDRRPAMTSASQPLDAGNAAARGLDARDGAASIFDHRRHMVRVGVNDAVGVARDGDMAFPEDQVAAPQDFRRR
jgi:hypothetical protein